jgi:hypothetical protein
MADNDYRAYRSRDVGRDVRGRDDADVAARDTPYDPLEELARIIGQGGQSAEYGRGARQNLNDSLADEAPAAPAAEWAADEAYAEPDAYEQQRYADPPEDDRYAEPDQDDRYAQVRLADPPPPSRAYAPDDRRDEVAPPVADRYPAPAERFGDPRASARGYDPRYREESAPAPARSGGRSLPPLPPQSQDDAYDSDDQWHDRDQGQSESEEFYDEAPRPRRRTGVVVMAVLGLLLVGGAAAAFGYREIYGGTILPTLPPIIKAGDGPNKIVPAPGASTQAGTPDAGAGEHLVPRQEQPVTIQPPNVPPRVVETIPVAPSTPSALPFGPAPGSVAPPPAAPFTPPVVANPPPGALPGPSAQAPSAIGPEPKKIHTVPVGPDQVGGAHVATAGPTAIAPPPPARVNPAAAPVARPSPPSAPRVDKGAPLAIVPIAQGAPAPVAPPRSQVARTEERPAPTATAPAAAASTGGYGVQVTSQRSEAEAQAAFRELKGKYPDQLGNRQPIIRRADLGDKGTFYRALVGPFGSREQAIQVCTTLKAAGGSCIVQGI